MGVDFSPMVFDTWGGTPQSREGGGEGDVRQVHRLAPSQSPPSGGRCRVTGPQRATGPLGGTSAGGPHDGDNGGTGMVGGRTPAHPRLRSGGKHSVVNHGLGIPRL